MRDEAFETHTKAGITATIRGHFAPWLAGAARFLRKLCCCLRHPFAAYELSGLHLRWFEYSSSLKFRKLMLYLAGMSNWLLWCCFNRFVSQKNALKGVGLR